MLDAMSVITSVLIDTVNDVEYGADVVGLRHELRLLSFLLVECVGLEGEERVIVVARDVYGFEREVVEADMPPPACHHFRFAA